MTVPKQEVIDLVRQLPDNVDVEDLIYRLYLREKLAAALAGAAQRQGRSPDILVQVNTGEEAQKYADLIANTPAPILKRAKAIIEGK